MVTFSAAMRTWREIRTRPITPTRIEALQQLAVQCAKYDNLVQVIQREIDRQLTATGQTGYNTFRVVRILRETNEALHAELRANAFAQRISAYAFDNAADGDALYRTRVHRCEYCRQASMTSGSFCSHCGERLYLGNLTKEQLFAIARKCGVLEADHVADRETDRCFVDVAAWFNTTPGLVVTPRYYAFRRIFNRALLDFDFVLIQEAARRIAAIPTSVILPGAKNAAHAKTVRDYEPRRIWRATPIAVLPTTPQWFLQQSSVMCALTGLLWRQFKEENDEIH